MTKPRKIIVRGRQRSNIDPVVFVQLLIGIGQEWEREQAERPVSPDVYDAAIEDRSATDIAGHRQGREEAG